MTGLCCAVSGLWSVMTGLCSVMTGWCCVVTGLNCVFSIALCNYISFYVDFLYTVTTCNKYHTLFISIFYVRLSRHKNVVHSFRPVFSYSLVCLEKQLCILDVFWNPIPKTNKRPMGLTGHLNIKDCTLTSSQINSPSWNK